MSRVSQWPIRAKCRRGYWYGLVIEREIPEGTRLGQFTKLDCGDRLKCQIIVKFPVDDNCWFHSRVAIFLGDI